MLNPRKNLKRLRWIKDWQSHSRVHSGTLTEHLNYWHEDIWESRKYCITVQTIQNKNKWTNKQHPGKTKGTGPHNMANCIRAHISKKCYFIVYVNCPSKFGLFMGEAMWYSSVFVSYVEIMCYNALFYFVLLKSK